MLASAVTFWRWLTGQPPLLDARTTPAQLDSERRVWVRCKANLDVRCEEVGSTEDAVIPAVVCDISHGGVKLIAPRYFEPGTLLSVELPVPPEQAILVALACVVHANLHGDGEWAMGCRFSGELNDRQLQAFGASRTRPTPPDPRSWSRFPCDAKAVYQRINGDDRTHHSARVLNIAAAGMALLVDEDVAPGELLSIELLDSKEQPIVTILACVVHVQTAAEGQGQVLGCNFIHELNDKVLQALR